MLQTYLADVLRDIGATNRTCISLEKTTVKVVILEKNYS